MLDEDFAAQSIVSDVIADQHALDAIRRTPLVHINIVVLENNLGFDRMQTGRANRTGSVVKKVGTRFSVHGFPGCGGAGYCFSDSATARRNASVLSLAIRMASGLSL